MIKRHCLCNRQLYRVRSYTYDFLRAIQPFYELVAISRMPKFQIEQIIKHLEKSLNRHRIQQNKLNFLYHPGRKNLKMRGNTEINKDRTIYLEPQVFFQFILNEDQDFILIENQGKWVPNLQLLLRNRKKE